jgi:hypothetical protein
MSTHHKIWTGLIERLDSYSLSTVKLSEQEIDAILAIDTRLKHIEYKLEELLDLVAPDV